MYGHTSANNSSDKPPDVIKQILDRLAALENSVSESKTELEDKKTQGSQTILTDINEERSDTKNKFSKTFMLELMKAVNFPGKNGDTNCKFDTFIWVFIQLLVLCVSFIYIKDAYETLCSSPIVIYESNELKPVKDIPAPAVTICFPTGVTREKSDEIFTSLETCLKCDNATEKDPFSKLCSFNKACDWDSLYSGLITRKICPYGYCTGCTIMRPYLNLAMNEVTNGSLHSYFQELLSLCDSLLNFTLRVDTLEPERGCDSNNIQWFLSGVEERQLCMSYNSQPYSSIYRDGVVLPLSTPDTHTNSSIKEITPNIFNFHNFTFNFESYNDIYLQNFRNCHLSESATDIDPSVYVHNPAEIPLKKYLNDDDPIRWGSYFNVIVTPELILADSAIRTYSPLHRNCYFPEERWLLLYETYSQAKCKVECFLNCSIENCGCVPFNLPRPNASVKVCLDSHCDTNCDCNCLPNCESLSYTLHFKEKPLSPGDSFVGIKMVMMFKTKEFRFKVRYSLSSFSEFVAYSLGVLGTFNGLSVITLWKLIYLLIIRVWNLALYFCKCI